MADLFHFGTPRKSGRYPWGSGKDPNQRNKQFSDYVRDMKSKGLSETDIASGLGMTTAQLRNNITIYNAQRAHDRQHQAQQLAGTGMSNVAIGREMGLSEGTVRNLLNPARTAKREELDTVANILKDNVAKSRYLDVGAGTGNHLGVSATRIAAAVAKLEEEGYQIHYVKMPQLGTGKFTKMKVLVGPETTYRELMQNRGDIKNVANYSEDGGRTFLGIRTPTQVSSKRIGVRYGDEGGADKDGVIELRRGVADLSLHGASYAQVRIGVDGTHYLKGMAMYSDKMPPGVDIVFNTNKANSGNKLDAMKGIKDDEDNPFGSVIRQIDYVGPGGKKLLSPLNIVGSDSPDGDSTSGVEGGWSTWSKTFSSQMLSKQSPVLAKQQLELTFKTKQDEFNEIMALNNPAVKKKLLESFADGVDSASVTLKAAGLPRTAQHVILPINSLKDNEIYAPWYNNGEKVVLIRHPHGGKFEIPELTVNNRNPEANSVMKDALDAVGINSRVAKRLSGADFDGDTVLVIPNNQGHIRTRPALKGLEDFDPIASYKLPDGIKFEGNKQQLMGNVSNLITDMTIRGATESELARAVRHSMVVIDAEKHDLDHKRSAADNGIRQLKAQYQGGAGRGASTLISRASSEQRVLQRKDNVRWDPETGKKIYTETGNSYENRAGKKVFNTTKSTRMAEVDDAYSLSSGTTMEAVYANHANRLKALANTARKEYLGTKDREYSSTAKQAYSKEVQDLNHKLNIAQKNAPQERRAQTIANAVVQAKRQANPHMDPDAEKKIKSQALAEARVRTGAKKQRIQITESEWAAIQAGAISTSKLNQILANADLDQIKELATPRTVKTVSGTKLARARAMLAAGHSQGEIATALGVAPSTLRDALS